MQRLFSTFPEGWPGTGLVFLRAVMTIPLVHFGAGPLPPTAPSNIIVQLIAAVCSTLLLVGLWTPTAGVTLALSELCFLLFPPSDASMHILLAAIGASLAMLGPGAWSIDARLFGRKRIHIPQR